MNLFRSAFTVSSFTLLSRILGYIRDVFLAYALVAGIVADAFVVAFRLPNMFRSLSAEGAFNSAFVPLFSGVLAREGKEKSVIFASHVFSFMAAVLFLFVLAMIIFMPYVMIFLAPGFTGDSMQFDLAVDL